MPSFDITSEVDMVALRNAVEGANRKITGRYDFKGSDARVEQSEKLLTLHGDNDFQLEQMLAILLPEMTAKKIVKLIKDSKLKVQASIQGEAVRVSGAKRDLLQECIALVRKEVADYPLQYGNFRD